MRYKIRKHLHEKHREASRKDPLRWVPVCWALWGRSKANSRHWPSSPFVPDYSRLLTYKSGNISFPFKMERNNTNTHTHKSQNNSCPWSGVFWIPKLKKALRFWVSSPSHSKGVPTAMSFVWTSPTTGRSPTLIRLLIISSYLFIFYLKSTTPVTFIRWCSFSSWNETEFCLMSHLFRCCKRAILLPLNILLPS